MRYSWPLAFDFANSPYNVASHGLSVDGVHTEDQPERTVHRPRGEAEARGVKTSFQVGCLCNANRDRRARTARELESRGRRR